MSRKLLGNKKPGILFIVSAPAGTGKTTLVKKLEKEFSCVVRNITCTTREPREEEKNGKDYYFLSKEEFEKKIEKGDFLEYAKVFDNYYGSSKKFVEEETQAGKHVILVIDTQGALKIKEQNKGIYIFITPPSLEELQKRLEKRSSESKESIEKRLKWAKEEMKAITYYDYQIINDDLEIAYQTLRSILIAEECKIRGKLW